MLAAGQLLIRPVTRHDAGLIVEARRYTSEQSVYRRYHGPKPRLSARELRYLTDVDGRRHLAFVAVERRPDGSVRMAGIARAIRPDADAARAEVAVLVADPYQGRGLGKQLFAVLLDACADAGIEELLAEILSDNRPALALMRSLRPESRAERHGTVTRLIVPA